MFLNTRIEKYRNMQLANSAGRIDALDLYRFIAIVLMIQGHTIFAIAEPAYISNVKMGWEIWTFIRGLTAPIFMMISGAVNVFANKRLPDGRVDNKKVLKRIRTAIILLITAYASTFPLGSLRFLGSFDYKYWLFYFQTNILHITAVCLIILQIFQKLSRNDKHLFRYCFAYASFSLGIAWFVQMVDWYELLPLYLAPYLSYKHGAIYALYPVSAYFFFGVCLGVVLRNTPKDKLFDTIFKKGVLLGLIMLLIGWFVYWKLDMVDYPYCTVSLVNPGLMILRMGIVLMVFPLIVILHDKIKSFSWLYLTLSKKSFFLFVVHLIVIYGCAAFYGINHFWDKNLSGAMVFVGAILVEAISLVSAYYYDKTVKFLPSVRYAYLSLLIITVFIINLVQY